MLDVWRKTVQMLRGCPELLLTLFGVSLVGFHLEGLNKALARWIMRWVEASQSVLGFETQAPDPTGVIQKKAFLLATPVSLCLRVTIFSVYVAGFVLTARLVRNFIQDQEADWLAALAFLRSRMGRVILFGAAIVVVFAVAPFLVFQLLDVQAFVHLRMNVSFDLQVSILTFVVCSCIAWIMLPFGLRLIADLPPRPIPREKKTQGRIAAIAAAAIGLVLYYFSTSFAPSINGAFRTEAWLRNLVIWPGISILGNLPLLLLWVMLALLVYQDLEAVEVPSPS